MSKEDYSKCSKARMRCDVNNHLGIIHNLIRSKIPKGTEISLKPIDNKKFKHIYFSENVIDDDLAKKVRDFLNDIPFNTEKQLLNDTDNQPLDSIFKDLKDEETILQKCNNPIHDPKLWTYEKYHDDFWRISPLNLEAFIGSPIFQLISVLEEKLNETTIEDINIGQYEKTTCVLQLIPKGHGCAYHTDDTETRKIAFIYYLTPDDWTNEDGGQLGICHKNNKDDYRLINPKFNSIVIWQMKENKCPLHFVTHVKSDKPRYALVGFYE